MIGRADEEFCVLGYVARQGKARIYVKLDIVEIGCVRIRPLNCLILINRRRLKAHYAMLNPGP